MIGTDPLRHHPLIIDGERVGDVVSLGLRVVFFTTDRRLAGLDGKHFAGFDSAAATVREALAEALANERTRATARPRPWRATRPAASAMAWTASPAPRRLPVAFAPPDGAPAARGPNFRRTGR